MNPEGPTLSLTEFLDVRTLQAVQDSFAALTHLPTTIRDAQGQALTRTWTRAERGGSGGQGQGGQGSEPPEVATDWLGADPIDLDAAGPLVAPIIVHGQLLGTISVEGEPPVPPVGSGGTGVPPAIGPQGRIPADGGPVLATPATDHSRPAGPTAGGTPAPPTRPSPPATPATPAALRQWALDAGLPAGRVDELIDLATRACAPSRATSLQFLYFMANALARLCYQEYQLEKRVDELSTLYRVSQALAHGGDLQQVLDTAARSVVEAMNCKAAMIRLLDDAGAELIPRAIYNLSQGYMDKGPILVAQSRAHVEALAGKVVYVSDMATDPRTVYPGQAGAEGLKSLLCVGIIFQGRPIGVIQLYTAEVRDFSDEETDLLRAISQLLAAAISSARLAAQRDQDRRLALQLKMAADVQKRMLPQEVPVIPGLPPFEIACRYVPSAQLSGDFYDLIPLGTNLGIAVADVAGKGVAASLLMASVRSSLRAFAQDVYDIDAIMSRVNVALVRDTLANEFATLFYGVLDPPTRRFTYCNAGHEPPLLARAGKVSRLTAGGMIVGIDPRAAYDKGILDLAPGDVILFYTDGLSDAQNFQQQRFGRQRVAAALLEAAERSAQDIANHVLWEMRRYVGLNQPTDDTTLVVVKYAR